MIELENNVSVHEIKHASAPEPNCDCICCCDISNSRVYKSRLHVVASFFDEASLARDAEKEEDRKVLPSSRDRERTALASAEREREKERKSLLRVMPFGFGLCKRDDNFFLPDSYTSLLAHQIFIYLAGELTMI